MLKAERDWSERPDFDDLDSLTRICPQCGGFYDHPDCSCGYGSYDDEPQTREELLRAYLDAGFALTPLAEGQKRPEYPNWQKEPYAIRTPERLGAIRHGVGLLHRWSTPLTCTLDVDDYGKATAWLAAHGIDLGALLAADDAVQIRSGRPNRAKLLFRLPEGTDAPVTETVRDAAGNMVLEFRCANSQGESVQDVLPPSINPDSGLAYTWAGAGSWRRLPVIPESLLTAWETLRAAYRQGAERPESSYSNTTTVPNETAADLRSALLAMRADDHDLWIRMGLALHELGDQGRALWLEWSATSVKFEPSEAARRWDTFEPNRTGYQAVFAEAQRRGWVNPRSRANAQHGQAGGQRRQTPYELVPAPDLTKAPTPIRWLLRGFLEAGSLNLLWGDPGTGKSLFALDWAFCLAAGFPWEGVPTTKTDVVVIAGEGFAGLGRRLRALEMKYGITAPANLRISRQAADFADAGSAEWVAEAVRTTAPDAGLVIVDTLHRNMSGDENSSQDIGAFLANLDAYFRSPALGAAVLVVHHAGHGDKGRARGSSSIRGAMDAEFSTSPGHDKEVTLSCHKSKDFEPFAPMGFRIEPMTLGDCWIDEDGEPLTSVILHATEHRGGHGPRKRLSARDELVLQSLGDAIAKHGVRPSAALKAQFGGFDGLIGEARKVVHIDHWREFAEPHIDVDANSIPKTFKRCRDKLFEFGRVRHFDGFWWPIFNE